MSRLEGGWWKELDALDHVWLVEVAAENVRPGELDVEGVLLIIGQVVILARLRVKPVRLLELRHDVGGAQVGSCFIPPLDAMWEPSAVILMVVSEVMMADILGWRPALTSATVADS